MKFYAISLGRKTGIFTDLTEYQAYTQGYKRARAKSFSTYQAAHTWLQKELKRRMPKKSARSANKVDRIELSKRVKQSILSMNAQNVFALDIELTGLTQQDEILQFSIVNGLGQLVFNRYFRPLHIESWDETIPIHHITPDDVANAAPFKASLPMLNDIFQQAKVIIGYNTMQDIYILRKFGVRFPSKLRYVDVGEAYTFVHQGTSPHRTYAKLQECALHYQYEDTMWHNSLADTYATLHVFYAMLHDAKALFRFM